MHICLFEISSYGKLLWHNFHILIKTSFWLTFFSTGVTGVAAICANLITHLWPAYIYFSPASLSLSIYIYIYMRPWCNGYTIVGNGHSDTIGKGMNPTILPTVMDEVQGRLGSLTLALQPVEEKENFKLQLVKFHLCWWIYFFNLSLSLSIYIYIYIKSVHIYLSYYLSIYLSIYLRYSSRISKMLIPVYGESEGEALYDWIY